MNIVISGVNLTEAGGLKVFKDAIRAFSGSEKFSVTCLVHDVHLFEGFDHSRIKFIEYSDVKSSWIKRVLFEYVACKSISTSLTPDIWLSMHDMTPNTKCPVKLVYCHNPAPFYNPGLKDLIFEPKLVLFAWFYKLLYRINIRKNDAVIVQQAWLGKFFDSKFNVNRYIVAKPIAETESYDQVVIKPFDQQELIIFYPSLARTFKNFELLLQAMEYLKLSDHGAYSKVRLRLTIDQNSNRYASSLVKQYGSLEQVDFLGTLSFSEVKREYERCDIVAFPSKLETWGLPISESKQFAKPLLLADLPYARETLGNYNSACFIDSDDFRGLAITITKVLEGESVFEAHNYNEEEGILRGWESLVSEINALSNRKLSNG